MNSFILGTGRDGSKEWGHRDLSTDGKIVLIHTSAKGVHLMKSISPTGTAVTSTWSFCMHCVFVYFRKL